jgi:hypothetical protein
MFKEYGCKGQPRSADPLSKIRRGGGFNYLGKALSEVCVILKTITKQYKPHDSDASAVHLQQTLLHISYVEQPGNDSYAKRKV